MTRLLATNRDGPIVGQLLIVIAVVLLTGSFAVAAGSTDGKSPSFEGYDFSVVVEKLADSVDPLEKEMENSFEGFIKAVDEAEQLLAQGETRQAVGQCADAVDKVLESRDTVLKPMWEGQQFLTQQVSWVRTRLARALAAESRDATNAGDSKTEKMLDSIAARIPNEQDPIRKKWLVAHYKTVRDIGRIRQMAEKLTPDQRKLWISVLSILDEASLAHQQVLMGSEVLFAQFESTATRLKEYQTLLDTVKSADDLLSMVRGMNEAGSDMGNFTQSMSKLQERLGGFNNAVENALQDSMIDLESKIESIQPDPYDDTPGGVVSVEQDDELLERIDRVTGQQ